MKVVKKLSAMSSQKKNTRSKPKILKVNSNPKTIIPKPKDGVIEKDLDLDEDSMLKLD